MGRRNDKIAARAAELVQLDVPDVDIETARLAKEELEKTIAGAADMLAEFGAAMKAGRELEKSVATLNEVFRKDVGQIRAELDEVKASLAGALRDVEGDVAQELRRRMEALEQRMIDIASLAGRRVALDTSPLYPYYGGASSYVGHRPW